LVANPARRAKQNPVTLELNGFFTRLKDTFDIVEDNNPATPERESTRINPFGADVFGVELNPARNLTEDLRPDPGFVEPRALFDEPAGDFGSRRFARTPGRYLSWMSRSLALNASPARSFARCR